MYKLIHSFFTKRRRDPNLPRTALKTLDQYCACVRIIKLVKVKNKAEHAVQSFAVEIGGQGDARGRKRGRGPEEPGDR